MFIDDFYKYLSLYSGRLKSLHLPVDTRGDCLVLPSALLTRNYHSEGLELTIVFHLDLPFPLGYPPEKEPDVEPEPPFCDL